MVPLHSPAKEVQPPEWHEHIRSKLVEDVILPEYNINSYSFREAPSQQPAAERMIFLCFATKKQLLSAWWIIAEGFVVCPVVLIHRILGVMGQLPRFD